MAGSTDSCGWLGLFLLSKKRKKEKRSRSRLSQAKKNRMQSFALLSLSHHSPPSPPRDRGRKFALVWTSRQELEARDAKQVEERGDHRSFSPLRNQTNIQKRDSQTLNVL